VARCHGRVESPRFQAPSTGLRSPECPGRCALRSADRSPTVADRRLKAHGQARVYQSVNPPVLYARVSTVLSARVPRVDRTRNTVARLTTLTSALPLNASGPVRCCSAGLSARIAIRRRAHGQPATSDVRDPIRVAVPRDSAKRMREGEREGDHICGIYTRRRDSGLFSRGGDGSGPPAAACPSASRGPRCSWRTRMHRNVDPTINEGGNDGCISIARSSE